MVGFDDIMVNVVCSERGVVCPCWVVAVAVLAVVVCRSCFCRTLTSRDNPDDAETERSGVFRGRGGGGGGGRVLMIRKPFT